MAGRASNLFAELLTDVGALLSGLLHCLDLGLEPFHLELEILLALPALLHRHVAHLVAQTSEKQVWNRFITGLETSLESILSPKSSSCPIEPEEPWSRG